MKLLKKVILGLTNIFKRIGKEKKRNIWFEVFLMYLPFAIIGGGWMFLMPRLAGSELFMDRVAVCPPALRAQAAGICGFILVLVAGVLLLLAGIESYFQREVEKRNR